MKEPTCCCPSAKRPDYIRGDCQSELLWTNEEVEL